MKLVIILLQANYLYKSYVILVIKKIFLSSISKVVFWGTYLTCSKYSTNQVHRRYGFNFPQENVAKTTKSYTFSSWPSYNVYFFSLNLLLFSSLIRKVFIFRPNRKKCIRLFRKTLFFCFEENLINAIIQKIM